MRATERAANNLLNDLRPFLGIQHHPRPRERRLVLVMRAIGVVPRVRNALVVLGAPGA